MKQPYGSTTVFAALFLAGVACLGGCAGGGVPLFGGSAGAFRIQSTGDAPISLSSRLTVAVFANEPAETSILLTDVPMEDLLAGRVRDGQVVHIELLWVPKAGSTPMAPSATNASVRHIIFSRGEVGVYGGAGFARPSGGVGGDTIRITLQDASMALADKTDGFVDLLTPARLSGSFTAKLDPRAARNMHHAVSQMVTNALDRSVLVDAGGAAAEPRLALRDDDSIGSRATPRTMP